MRFATLVLTVLASVTAPTLAAPRPRASTARQGTTPMPLSTTPTPSASSSASGSVDVASVLATLTPQQESMLVKALLNGPNGAANY
ncbi:hypothetical protein K488DRAFT_82384 [Vararia minispora EC-137]|uniref:Uncharacterized protein n=1 Tax=Vararia minispora EC-137 TaxID=1314806 RepID=A0ACB8QWD3_9AGAM|nr:hypothetical protein K488DRAFT_82384 [Vararia minispora EC-137]